MVASLEYVYLELMHAIFKLKHEYLQRVLPFLARAGTTGYVHKDANDKCVSVFSL